MGKLIIRWEGNDNRYGQETREIPGHLACKIFLTLNRLIELIIKIGKEEKDD